MKYDDLSSYMLDHSVIVLMGVNDTLLLNGSGVDFGHSLRIKSAKHSHI